MLDEVSPRQVELLVEFAETHTPIGLVPFQGPKASQAARQAWESLAMQLNSLADGTSKAPDQWHIYWIEFKARIITKAADLRRNASSIGEGPDKFVPLTSIEERVLAVKGLPEVRIPVKISIEETAAPVGNLIEEAAIPAASLNLNLKKEVECHEDILPPLPSLPPPNIVKREERKLKTTSPISFPSTSQRRSKISRPSKRDPDFPHWAYNLEMRRIESKHRQNTILENTHIEIQLLRETLKELVEVIKENSNQ